MPSRIFCLSLAGFLLVGRYALLILGRFFSLMNDHIAKKKKKKEVCTPNGQLGNVTKMKKLMM